MNNSVNIISVGNVKVNAQSGSKSAVKPKQGQQEDFSQTLDQAQQSRGKADSQGYDSKTEDAAKPTQSQENVAGDDAAEEQNQAAEDAKKKIYPNKGAEPSDEAKAAIEQEVSEEVENKGEEMDDPADSVMAEGAQASLNMVQNLPLAELSSYFKATYGENAAVEVEVSEQEQSVWGGNQLTKGDGEQIQDSLQLLDVVEDVQPVKADTQDAGARTPSVKAQQETGYAPSSIEALLRNSERQDLQGAGGVIRQQDTGRQMLNLLAGRQVYSLAADTVDAAGEDAVNVEKLADLTGMIEVAEPLQEQQSFAGAEGNGTQQQSMGNSLGQQQAGQMAGEAAFDVVLPKDEPQENTPVQSKEQTIGFEQVLAGSQDSNVYGTDQSRQANASQSRETYNVPQQIVEQARLLQRGTDTEMVIKLNPEHLGQLSLKVSVNGNGGVTATFHTDNAQVRAILENSMLQLKQQLNEQGIRVDNVDVQTGLPDGQLPQDQGQQGFYQGQQGQQFRSTRADLKDFEETTEALAVEMEESQASAQDIVLDSQGNRISTGVNYTV